jgi:hypothetical protein
MTTPTTMNMTKLATDIATAVGTEFPAPATEMPGRQYLSLVEEGDELDQALAFGSLYELRGELADTLITVYLLAHYLPETDLEGVLARGVDDGGVVVLAHKTPSYYITTLAGPLRRALGYARRPGQWSDVDAGLARIVLAVRLAARQSGVNLDVAVADKTRVIFSRGWRAATPITQAICGGCERPIVGVGWRHQRLGVTLHGNAECQVNVAGEDVRGHSMILFEVTP